MTRTIVTFGAVLVVLVLLLVARKHISSDKQSETKGRETYLGLRNMMLTGSRTKFSLAPTSSPTEPWGVTMDWSIDAGTATVVAMSDGSASVYLSSGGGFLGGIGQQPIRDAAKKAVSIAVEVQPQMNKTETFPLSEKGYVRFYTLTDAGVYTTTAPEVDLSKGDSPFSKLGNAMQAIITEYRIFQQKQQAPRS